MSLQDTLSNHVKQAVLTAYNIAIDTVEFQATRKEFAGDITVVIFPMLRFVKGNPVQIGEVIGNYLVDNVNEVKAFNVVKGFLNVEIADNYYANYFNDILNDDTYGFLTPKQDDKAVVVEYSSPNTNKPLHLGHVRNNLLGYSVAEILKASGKKVYKTQIINDRGIHICKSMLAWEKFGNGETPESIGLKGDKLVGNYYVKFDQEYKKEIQSLIETGKTEEEAKKQAPLLLEAQNMLQKWEAGDEEVVVLWKKMNAWVYEGFDITYKNLGVDFDTLYYESNTYLLGKEFVEQGLKTGVFIKEEDGSIWCDLTEDGLDKVTIARKDFDGWKKTESWSAIFNDKARLMGTFGASPAAEDKKRLEELEEVINNKAGIFQSIKKAEALKESGALELAWEEVHRTQLEYQNDIELARSVAEYSSSAAEFSSMITKAQKLELEDSSSFHALTWYLKAKTISPSSKYVNEGISRILAVYEAEGTIKETPSTKPVDTK